MVDRVVCECHAMAVNCGSGAEIHGLCGRESSQGLQRKDEDVCERSRDFWDYGRKSVLLDLRVCVADGLVC